jgi:hypothetical protein
LLGYSQKRGFVAGLLLWGQKGPAADQVVSQKKVWASLAQEPLQETLAKEFLLEYRERNPLTVAENLGGSLLVLGRYYPYSGHHRGSMAVCSLVRCYCHQRKTPP